MQSKMLENISSKDTQALRLLVFFWLGFIIWFVLQINLSTNAIASLLIPKNFWQNELIIRLGIVFGLASSLLSIGGIRLIKWLNVSILPFIFLCHIYAIFFSKEVPVFEGSWGISFSGIIYSLSSLLVGIVNLPTFFRHSRSRADSYLALSIMVIFISFFEISTIWMKLNVTYSNIIFSEYINFGELSIFIIFTYLCLRLVSTTLVNIYFASACWETIIPILDKKKQFAIIGLFGTAVYTFIQISSPMLFLEKIAHSFIAILLIVLIITFLVKDMVKNRPKKIFKIN